MGRVSWLAVVILLALLALSAMVARADRPRIGLQLPGDRRAVIVQGEGLRCLVVWRDDGPMGHGGALSTSCIQYATGGAFGDDPLRILR